MNPTPAACRARPAPGMTLIELMVALTVGMVLSLAAFAVLQVAEGRKRSLTAVNDVNQSGSYAMYLIDKWVRSAGTGLVQSASFSYGCALYAASGGTQVLPRTTAFPAPFDTVVSGVSGTLRLVPVLIFPGQTTPGISGQPSDVLVVMASSSGTGTVPTAFGGYAASGATGSISLANTLGFNASDLVLVADQQTTSTGLSNCMLQQVTSPFSGGTSTSLTLAGTYYSATIDTQSLTSYTSNAVAIDLGNAAGGNPPQFLMLGVGDNNTLYSYDLLQTQATPLQQVAEGIFEMHALYGVDQNADGKISPGEWVSPSATGYAPSDLMAGTAAANGVLQNIKAIRVGLILRTALPEKAGSAQAPTATSISLFDDTSLAYTRTFTSAEQLYRYRKVELTIPLRNNLLLN